MKTFRITLPDPLAAQLRLAAAREGLSVSKFITAQLSRALGGHADPLAPFDRWLASPGWDSDGDPAPPREDIHDRAVLRGHVPADLPARSQPGPPPGPDTA